MSAISTTGGVWIFSGMTISLSGKKAKKFFFSIQYINEIKYDNGIYVKPMQNCTYLVFVFKLGVYITIKS